MDCNIVLGRGESLEFWGVPWGCLPARFKADPGPEGVPRRSRGRSRGDPPREARRPVTVILGSVEETVGETVGGPTARFKRDSAGFCTKHRHSVQFPSIHLAPM